MIVVILFQKIIENKLKNMKNKVLDYIENVLEVPRDEYSGMPTCPFAKQERKSDNIYVDTITNDNDFIVCMYNFIESEKNSAVFIQDADLVAKDTKKYQNFLNNILVGIDNKKWKALCINPNDKLEVDGFNARSLAPCFLVLINNHKEIIEAHNNILKTKYYDKMDPKYKKYLGVK
jgi:hypothetical protein|tara:strand:- start:1241 stop:1768 length:528 start_codon:yes stop_codon:yes gene_type:complete